MNLRAIPLSLSPGSPRRALLWTVVLVAPLAGCGPTYRELRLEGQQAMLRDDYGTARQFFLQADERRPREIENLHDLGVCSVVLAGEQFDRMNRAAALRELDRAVNYYTRAIDAHPGHQACLEGKAHALKLKGDFDQALEHAEWTAEVLGPSARQYVFLAGELEDRGDLDGAYLRYRQAVAVDPDYVQAHVAFAKYLLRQGNEPAAVHHLQAAYRLDPTNTWVTTELASRGAVPHLSREPAPGQP